MSLYLCYPSIKIPARLFEIRKKIRSLFLPRSTDVLYHIAKMVSKMLVLDEVDNLYVSRGVVWRVVDLVSCHLLVQEVVRQHLAWY